MGVEEEEPVLLKPGKVPAEAAGGLDDLARMLLERHEHPGLPRPPRPFDEGLEREDRLPAPAPPTMRVVRPRGSPPSVSASRPGTERGKTIRSFPYPKVQRFLSRCEKRRQGFIASSLQAPQGIRSRALALPLIGSLRGLKWCRRRESNPHGLVDRGILSPLRLPFRHSGAPGRVYCQSSRTLRWRCAATQPATVPRTFQKTSFTSVARLGRKS